MSGPDSWLDGFTKLPAWVLVDERLTDGDRITLAYVLARIFRESYRLSQKEIRTHRGITDRGVRKHLSKLRELGYLRGTPGAGNVYTFAKGPALDAKPEAVKLPAAVPQTGTTVPGRNHGSGPEPTFLPGTDVPMDRNQGSDQTGTTVPTSVDEDKTKQTRAAGRADAPPTGPSVEIESVEIESLESRYGDRALVRAARASCSRFRKSGQMKDSMWLAFLRHAEPFAADVVERAMAEHVDKHEGKPESYLLGIIRGEAKRPPQTRQLGLRSVGMRGLPTKPTPSPDDYDPRRHGDLGHLGGVYRRKHDLLVELGARGERDYEAELAKHMARVAS